MTVVFKWSWNKVLRHCKQLFASFHSIALLRLWYMIQLEFYTPPIWVIVLKFSRFFIMMASLTGQFGFLWACQGLPFFQMYGSRGQGNMQEIVELSKIWCLGMQFLIVNRKKLIILRMVSFMRPRFNKAWSRWQDKCVKSRSRFRDSNSLQSWSSF